MRSLVPLALALAALSAHAQVVLQSGPYASSGSSASQNVVRDGFGNLYALWVEEQAGGGRALRLSWSSSDGAQWSVDPLVLNDSSSGLDPSNPTTGCALAIDSQGELHLSWGRYHYPSYYQQYYRRYDPQSAVASSIVNLSALTGASTGARTAAHNIVVDGDDRVWIVGHGAESWRETLLRSQQAQASGLAFTDVGYISPSSSAQNARLAVDKDGRVHCAYYRNVSPGNYEHRTYEHGIGWGLETTLGNTVPTNDYYGAIESDLLGNVHAMYVEDAHPSSSQWNFRYRRWDASSGWSSPVDVFSASNADFNGVASYRIFALACDALSGQVSALYRDLAAGGQLVIAQKGLADAGFLVVGELSAPDGAAQAYNTPTLRGSLYPASNQADAGGLDATWREPLSAGGSALLFRAGGASLVASPSTLSLVAGGVQTLELSAGPSFAGLPYLMLGSMSGTSPGLLLDGLLLPLVVDAYTTNTLLSPNTPPLAQSFGNLDAQGKAQAFFSLPANAPASLNGLQLHHAYMVIELIPGVILHVVHASEAAALLLVP